MAVTALIRSPEDLGLIIANVRRRYGLSQRQLAQRLQISQRYLSELELGKPKIADERYFRILALLGITIHAEVSDG